VEPSPLVLPARRDGLDLDAGERLAERLSADRVGIDDQPSLVLGEPGG
jgi:hypothetical protein